MLTARGQAVGTLVSLNLLLFPPLSIPTWQSLVFFPFHSSCFVQCDDCLDAFQLRLLFHCGHHGHSHAVIHGWRLFSPRYPPPFRRTHSSSCLHKKKQVKLKMRSTINKFAMSKRGGVHLAMKASSALIPRLMLWASAAPCNKHIPVRWWRGSFSIFLTSAQLLVSQFIQVSPWLIELWSEHNLTSILYTVGAIDPVQMTQQAPNQEILYVSGWACSSLLTSTNEVSPDFGDYPYNTVPNQVQRLFKAQSMHDRKQWDTRRKMTPDQRKDTPYIDYMRPIVADGDTG